MEEYLLLIILGFLILILLLTFRHKWIIIDDTMAFNPNENIKKQPIIIPHQNEAEPTPPCINKNFCCSKSTFGCCNDNIRSKGDSIGINCIQNNLK